MDPRFQLSQDFGMNTEQYERLPDIVLWFDEYYVDENLDIID